MRRAWFVAFLSACSTSPTEGLLGSDGGVRDGGTTARDGGTSTDAGVTDAGTRDGGPRDGGVFRPSPIPRRICGGDDFGCYVSDLDGEVICTGDFTFDPASLSPATSIACGAAHVCVVKTDRTLACVGEDADGQATPPPGDFVAVSAGDHHGCALDRTGGLTCWGRMLDVPSGVFIDVDSGARHACAVTRAGAMVCFGADDQTQSSPPAGPYDRAFLGGDRSCGKLRRGSMRCWGRARPDLGGAVRAALGERHACGINNRGFTFCQGDNDNGQTALRGNFVELGAGRRHTCGIRSNGDVECYGL